MRRSLFIPWLVLVVTLGVTWLIWDHERSAARLELRTQFDFVLRDTGSRIEQRVSAYEQLLRGVQGLFAAGKAVERAAFTDYVQALQLDGGFIGIQAIGVVEIVPVANMAAHQVSMRGQGFTDYAVYPKDEREFYAPIIQREPYIGRNRGKLGFDAWSEPLRREAMERSRDTGMVAITGRVRLAIEAEAEGVVPPSFIIYLPIYVPGLPHGSLEQRRTNLKGWVFISFRMTDFMASLQGEQPPGFGYRIFDGVGQADDSMIFRSKDDADPSAIPVQVSSEYLLIAGHTWTLSMARVGDFQPGLVRNAARLIAWGGGGLGLLLGLLSWLILTARNRALQLAGQMTKELRESEQRWAFALEGAGDGVWDWNLQTREAITSRRWNEIIGCNDSGAIRTIDQWEDLIHPDDRVRVLAAMQAYQVGTRAVYVVEYRLRCQGDTWKWVLSRGMAVESDAEGHPLRIIGTITDISERKAIDEKIHHMAQHDALTDLPNRALFSDRLQHALAQARRNDERFALIFLDLDNFKPINDNYGHAVGDDLLRQVARRLQGAVRESDTVGRIGGDEFVVLMPRLTEAADAMSLAEKMRLALRQPFTVDGRELHISCSLGVAVFPEDGEDEITLAKSADVAMYRAKGSGRDRVWMAQET